MTVAHCLAKSSLQSKCTSSRQQYYVSSKSLLQQNPPVPDGVRVLAYKDWSVFCVCIKQLLIWLNHTCTESYEKREALHYAMTSDLFNQSRILLAMHVHSATVQHTHTQACTKQSTSDLCSNVHIHSTIVLPMLTVVSLILRLGKRETCLYDVSLFQCPSLVIIIHIKATVKWT